MVAQIVDVYMLGGQVRRAIDTRIRQTELYQGDRHRPMPWV